MKKNVGNADRIIRIIIAALLVVLYAIGTVTGTVGIILLVLAGILLITSIANICPIWWILGINTRKKTE